MKVIGAGFGRTGTLSMKAALERLGFGPCYHMVEFLKRPQDGPHWMAALRGEPVDWRAIFGTYQATTDWPACNFWRELAEVHPEARVVLTVRDPERWWQSISGTLFSRHMAAALPGSDPNGPMAHVRPMAELLMGATFDGRTDDREHVIRRYEEHNERVREGVPPERLLVFDVAQGWGPLCEFLGVEAPVEPFPHLNEGANFEAMMRALRGGGSVPN